MDLVDGKKTVDWLKFGAYCYLAFPCAVFFLGYLRLYYALPLTALVALSLILVLRREKRGSGAGRFWAEHWRGLLLFAAILLLWVLLSGVGGYAWQNRWDHKFRNAVFQDLVLRDWPVTDGEGNALCYYFGFWLPAALVGKLFGLSAGYFALFLYALIGCGMAFALIFRYLGSFHWWAIVFFIFYSGLDAISYLIFQSDGVSDFLHKLLSGEHLELATLYFNSSSNTTLLYWLYNSCVPFWVAFPLLLLTQDKTKLPFPYALLLLFSPFAFVGLAPAVLFLMIGGCLERKRGWLRALVCVENFTALCIVAVVGCFFASNQSENVKYFLPLSGAVLVRFLAYAALEYGVYLIFLPRELKRDRILQILLATTALTSFFVMGSSYDFAWRTCMPLAFYIGLLLLKRLSEGEMPFRGALALFATVFLIGSMTAGMELLRVAVNTVSSLIENEPLLSDELSSIFLPNECYGNFVGSADSLFFRVFARMP